MRKSSTSVKIGECDCMRIGLKCCNKISMKYLEVCGRSTKRMPGGLSESVKGTATYKCFTYLMWEKPEVPVPSYNPLRVEAFSYYPHVDVSYLYVSDAHAKEIYLILYLADQMMHDLRWVRVWRRKNSKLFQILLSHRRLQCIWIVCKRYYEYLNAMLRNRK